MSNFEMCSQFDENILTKILSNEKYEWINSYDIKIKMFFKYGKYDKEGNLKTPALQKNGTAIPGQIKIVSAFNRMTDNVDVKIILNKEYWDDLLDVEREGVIDNLLTYLEVKKDKMDEPLLISEDSDKVQLKLKKPDFYCEGFLELIDIYGKDYLPFQDAKNISDKVKDISNDVKDNTKTTKTSKSTKTSKKNTVKELQSTEENFDDLDLDTFDVD